jgi:hypothetical protein
MNLRPATFAKAILTVLLATTSLACGPAFELATPPGFVELDDEWDNYDYRATTADGLVIAAREIDHEPQGDRAFWLEAIENRMRDRGGYALIERVEVESADGVAGTQLRFGHDDDGNRPHLYYLTVFVTSDAIVLVEAGGTKERVTENQAQIDQAVRGFRVGS